MPEDAYYGEFLNETYHGQGVYVWKENDRHVVYEGGFYCNSKTGYGLVSLLDGSTFEGLFLNNKAFGPGVFTDADGRQSVGFWQGSEMVRLIVPDPDTPQLAHTSSGVAKLLRFQTTNLPIDSKSAWDLLGCVANSSAHRSKLSNSIRDPQSLCFKKCKFDEAYFTDHLPDVQFGTEEKSELWSTDVKYSLDYDEEEEEGILHHISKSGTVPAKELQKGNDIEADHAELPLTEHSNHEHPVSYLTSWNHGDLFTKMMENVFLHRSLEVHLSFRITHLLSGARNLFHSSGYQEEQCFKYLKMCSQGPACDLKRFLCDNRISEELADSRGNNAIMIAAAGGQHEVIDVLLDRGVNVNDFNDEGLTPLNLCLLQRLALVNQATDWEASFLPPNDFKRNSELENGTNVTISSELVDWKKGSRENAMKQGGKHVTSELVKWKDTTNKYKKPAYLFSLEPAAGAKGNRRGKKQQQQTKQSKFVESEDNLELAARIQMIDKTIETILQRGADPNLSVVPQPSLHLAVFTRDEDIVQLMLSHGASPNQRNTVQDGSLTPLHVVVSLPPCEQLPVICELLLQYGADAKQETSPKFNLNRIKDVFVEDMQGRTPLQLLCMRPDTQIIDPEGVLYRLAQILISASSANHYLQGYSCLGLAMLRGNIKMVEALLIGGANPNEDLGHNLGTCFDLISSAAMRKQFSYQERISMHNLLLKNGRNISQKAESTIKKFKRIQIDKKDDEEMTLLVRSGRNKSFEQSGIETDLNHPRGSVDERSRKPKHSKKKRKVLGRYSGTRQDHHPSIHTNSLTKKVTFSEKELINKLNRTEGDGKYKDESLKIRETRKDFVKKPLLKSTSIQQIDETGIKKQSQAGPQLVLNDTLTTHKEASRQFGLKGKTENIQHLKKQNSEKAFLKDNKMNQLKIREHGKGNPEIQIVRDDLIKLNEKMQYQQTGKEEIPEEAVFFQRWRPTDEAIPQLQLMFLRIQNLATPLVVFRDGHFYYYFNGQPKFVEQNYSFC